MIKVIILFTSLTVAAFAQENILSLEDCLKLGIENSGEIKISKSKVTASLDKVTEINSQMFPKLSLAASYTYLNIIEPEQLNVFSTAAINIQNPFYSYGLNLSLQVPIFTGFKLSSLKSSAELRNKAIGIDLDKSINQKALDIHTAYWNLYKAKKSADLTKQYLELLQLKLEDTKQFLENGLATRNDLLKFEVEVAKAELKLIDMNNKVNIAEALLNKQIGRSLDEQIEIKEDLVIDTSMNFSYDELVDQALSSRYELKSLDYLIEAGEENISAANSGWWPKLYGSGSFYYQTLNAKTFAVKDQSVKSWFAGLTLSWDLWDWNYTSARSSQATEEVLQSREKRKLLKDQIELEVYNNFLSVIGEKKKITLSKLTVESAKENYRLVEDKYNNQLETSTELINAQTDLIDAEIRLATAIADYSLAITKLKMASGRIIY